MSFFMGHVFVDDHVFIYWACFKWVEFNESGNAHMKILNMINSIKPMLLSLIKPG